jgi:hypothetical protein
MLAIVRQIPGIGVARANPTDDVIPWTTPTLADEQLAEKSKPDPECTKKVHCRQSSERFRRN